MGSNKRRKRQRKVLTADEVAANREKEAKRQRERRARIRNLDNLGASSSTIGSEDENNEDTMMDAEVEEENAIGANSGAFTNQVLETGMSSQPNKTYSDKEIDLYVFAGYSLNELDFIPENRVTDYIAHQTPQISNVNHNDKQSENQTPIESEIQTPIEIDNQTINSEINNVDVDIETTIEKETPLDDNEMNEQFQIKNDVLDNLDGLVSWRQIRTYASRLFRQFFYNKEFGFQCQLMLQLIKMTKMRKVMKRLGIYVKSKKNDESLKQVVSTVASAFDTIGKKSRSKDRNAARRAITTALVNKTTCDKRMMTNISGYLNIHRKTLARAVKRRVNFESDPANHLWSFSGRLPRSDMKLTGEVKTLIENFWHDNTRVSPNARDVLKLRVGSKIHDPHPKHLLDMTQTELYNKFVDAKVLTISISQRSFEKCKPWYVRINKERVTCCCKIHVQFRYHYDVFRSIRSTMHTNEMLQECGINIAPQTVKEFISGLFCNPPNEHFFLLNACVSGVCDVCGNLAFLDECLHENISIDFGNQLVDVKRFKTIEYPLKDGKVGKRCELITEKVSVHAFMNEFKNKVVPKYVKHSQNARWLDGQFRICKNTFPIGSILSVVDFAENYTLAPQDEIQPQYYNSVQVTMFVHIVYRHAPNSTEDDQNFLREYHFYMSDNKLHSSEFVQYCFEIFFENLREREIHITQHLIWSDNCTGQFKNARMFYWLSRTHKKSNVQHIWSFFEAGHGKGEHDGAGACVKRALCREQLKFEENAKFKDARAIVEWCKTSLSTGSSQNSTIRHFFWLVEENYILSRHDCDTISGCAKWHSFMSSNSNTWTMWTRELACFCQFCVAGEWEECENMEWVEEWQQKSLTPSEPQDQDDIRNEDLNHAFASEDYDRVSDLIEPGHVYVVVAPEDNEEQTDYWLARCVQPKKKLICHEVDDDGFEYPIGSVVVVGTWLRKYLTRRNGLPAFEDYQSEKKIIHYSHLVVATNIKLERYKGKPANKILWTLSMEDHEAIIDALQKREDADGTLG